MIPITFVVPVGNREIYENFFISSPLFKNSTNFQIISQEGYPASGEAFNDAIDKAVNDIIVFAHQDVVFPSEWGQLFLVELKKIEVTCDLLGVVGCIGITSSGQPSGHIYRHNRDILHKLQLPAEVETLDELLICFRKSSGLRFDVALPSFFYYAVDICLQANAKGFKNFVVDVPCFHQATYRKSFRKEFYDSQKYMIDKWKTNLPVQTLSGVLERKKIKLTQIARSLKQFIYYLICYSPPPWWTKYQLINPNDILNTKKELTKQNGMKSWLKIKLIKMSNLFKVFLIIILNREVR